MPLSALLSTRCSAAANAAVSALRSGDVVSACQLLVNIGFSRRLVSAGFQLHMPKHLVGPPSFSTKATTYRPNLKHPHQNICATLRSTQTTRTPAALADRSPPSSAQHPGRLHHLTTGSDSFSREGIGWPRVDLRTGLYRSFSSSPVIAMASATSRTDDSGGSWATAENQLTNTTAALAAPPRTATPDPTLDAIASLVLNSPMKLHRAPPSEAVAGYSPELTKALKSVVKIFTTSAK